MPIPALQNEDGIAEGQAALRLVNSRAMLSSGNLVYARAMAHFVDACVLYGFSAYAAKFFSVVLISIHAHSISATGKVASSVFQNAFAYSNTQLFTAAFAALTVLYFVGLPLVFSRTPGQAVFGLRLCGENGSAITLRQLLLRLGGMLFTYGSGGILCLSGLRSREGRFVHDIVSGSMVTKE